MVQIVPTIHMNLVTLFRGHTQPAVLRTYIWLCSGISPGRLRRLYRVPGIEPRLTTSNAGTLPPVLAVVQPPLTSPAPRMI